MDLLYLHRSRVDFYGKAIECVDDNQEPSFLQGKKKTSSVRMVTTMKENHSHRKRCNIFAVRISSDKGKEVEDVDALNKYPILQKFNDVFLEEITDLQRHRVVDVSIKLVYGETPTSKAPYRMSTPKLVQLKL